MTINEELNVTDLTDIFQELTSIRTEQRELKEQGSHLLSCLFPEWMLESMLQSQNTEQSDPESMMTCFLDWCCISCMALLLTCVNWKLSCGVSISLLFIPLRAFTRLRRPWHQYYTSREHLLNQIVEGNITILFFHVLKK